MRSNVRLRTSVFDLGADPHSAGMPPVDCTLNAVRQTVLMHSLFNDAVSGSSTGEWRNIHNEELTGVYASPSNIRVIESRIRWVERVVRMGGTREVHTGFW